MQIILRAENKLMQIVNINETMKQTAFTKDTIKDVSKLYSSNANKK